VDRVVLEGVLAGARVIGHPASREHVFSPRPRHLLLPRWALLLGLRQLETWGVVARAESLGEEIVLGIVGLLLVGIEVDAVFFSGVVGGSGRRYGSVHSLVGHTVGVLGDHVALHQV
jgi:hypothetical protein